MMMVDAQIHVWSRNRPDRRWPQGRGQYSHGPALSAEEVLRVMDETGVARAVLVPPSWIGDDNSDSLAAARRYPDRFAVMGRFDPAAPDARVRITRWLNEPGMRGMRFTLHRPPWRTWLADGTLDWFWSAAEAARIPLMILVPGQLAAAGAIAERHPRLRVILDHLARPSGTTDDAAFADLDQLLALARHPNVAVKVTSLPSYSTEAYPFPGLHRHIRRVHDAFGARRMLWGTDYSRLPVPYEDAIRLFTEALDFLSADDREWIMGRATAEWIGWSL
ncbi:MAG: amidohydrolase [Candidatus Rokubacteria bacterium]|nr:amidohydrolase [Candidatus Rokubacteria bacterium]